MTTACLNVVQEQAEALYEMVDGVHRGRIQRDALIASSGQCVQHVKKNVGGRRFAGEEQQRIQIQRNIFLSTEAVVVPGLGGCVALGFFFPLRMER